MGLLANINQVSQALTDIVVSTAGLSKSVENLVDSANHSTGAIKAHAAELEQQAIDDCKKKADKRAKELAELAV